MYQLSIYWFSASLAMLHQSLWVSWFYTIRFRTDEENVCWDIKAGRFCDTFVCVCVCGWRVGVGGSQLFLISVFPACVLQISAPRICVAPPIYGCYVSPWWWPSWKVKGDPLSLSPQRPMQTYRLWTVSSASNHQRFMHPEDIRRTSDGPRGPGV